MFSIQHFIKQRGSVWVSCTYYAKNHRDAVALMQKYAMRGIPSLEPHTIETRFGCYHSVFRTDKKEYFVLRNAKATAQQQAICNA